MDLPLELKEALEERTQAAKREQLLSAAQDISRQYRAQQVNGGHVVTTAASALAYAAARMPATYGAVRTALEQVRNLLPEGAIRSVLDVGAGTGAGSWAARDVFDPERTVCLEREDAMRELGEGLMTDADRHADWRKFDLTRDGTEETASLVLASYVLNELPERERIPALIRLWRSAERVLLIVEPGTPEGYRQLMTAREALLAEGAHVLAPCPQEGVCPLPEDDWCHFTCRVARTRLHKALKGGDAPYEDEKFCYLALSRGGEAAAESRVLRHPLIEPGKITVKLCGRDGIVTREIRKRDGELFRRARKVSAGDSF